MPSHSSRSSTVDGDYESWDHPSSDSKKKSRSKLPAEDKLSVSTQKSRCNQFQLTKQVTETPRPKPGLPKSISAKEREAYQRVGGQGRGVRTPPGVGKPREQSGSFANEPYGRGAMLLSPPLIFRHERSRSVTAV